jgi:hypothetical protein
VIPWRRSIESSIAVPNEQGLGNGFVVADSLGRFLFTGSLGRFAFIDSLGRFVFTDSQGRFVSIDSLGRFVFTDSLDSSEDRNFISKKTHGCCYYAAQSDIQETHLVSADRRPAVSVSLPLSSVKGRLQCSFEFT